MRSMVRPILLLLIVFLPTASYENILATESADRYSTRAQSVFSMLHAQDSGKQTEPTVFLTHRKFWLASGGFNPNKQSKPDKASPDYIKDFRKQCAKVTVTDMQARPDYAVTIDYIGLFQPNALTFQVAVYSRNAGLIYMGGTNLLKNAIKDACNAIGTTK